MGKIISIANQKGGVGKTTTTVNLAAALGALKKKILVVDIDPQGNATSGMGLSKKEGESSSYDMIIGGKTAAQVIRQTEFLNVWIIPSSMALAGAEIELVELNRRESRLKEALSQVRESFDYILIDCPPSLGLITLNALSASDTVLVPIQCEYFALEGLSQLISTIRQVKRLYNETIDIEGVLLTMYDGRLNLTQQVVVEVKKFFPKKVFRTVIPRAVRISEAPSFGQPILYYDKTSKGSEAYMDLAKELNKNNKKRV
ncbi:MAG: AAA family ATPase [Oscillospiraceae bacterium]|jgi:chromosome partitioning protein|nr:AAA family ATPase [Oscillospiraceae bacterium]